MSISAGFLQSPPIDRDVLREQIRQQVREGVQQARAAAEAAEGAQAQPPLPPAPPAPPDFITGIPPHFAQPQVPDGAVIISLAFFIAVVLLVLGMPLMRALGRRAERRHAVAIADPEAKQQLRELSHAVEAIAIEVERLASGQREVTRVLSERGPSARVLEDSSHAR